ncbi:MAG: SRPBCC family protein [Bacteroidia bacterium]
MENQTATATITVEATLNAPVEKVWKLWTEPQHITQWNNASDDWHTPHAENDLRIGGKFTSRMEAKDGSMGFDFWGVYDDVRKNEIIEYTMGDGRKAKIIFTNQENSTHVDVTFEAENENPVEMQRGGWQAILNSFKRYVESN